METLHGKSVFVVTRDGDPVALGRFYVEGAGILETGTRVELVFETEAMSCRLRVPQAKIEDVKATWNGRWYRYVLPAGDSVWRGIEGGRREVGPPDEQAVQQ